MAWFRILCYNRNWDFKLSRGGNFWIITRMPFRKNCAVIYTSPFFHMLCMYTHKVKCFPRNFWLALLLTAQKMITTKFPYPSIIYPWLESFRNPKNPFSTLQVLKNNSQFLIITNSRSRPSASELQVQQMPNKLLRR